MGQEGQRFVYKGKTKRERRRSRERERDKVCDQWYESVAMFFFSFFFLVKFEEKGEGLLEGETVT